MGTLAAIVNVAGVMLRATGTLGKWASIAVLAVMVSACVTEEPGSLDTAVGGGEPPTSPPVTESETGRVVGQAVMVEDLWVAVSEEGVVSFVVFGTVPSTCHEAVIGFEEPNADGLLLGSAESWLDPACSATDEPAPFYLTVPVPGLAQGQYTVRLPGAGDRLFTIPNVGRVDGPVLVSPVAELDDIEFGSTAVGTTVMTAGVGGTVIFDNDTGCLLIVFESIRDPIVWPAGTSWRSDPPGVRLEDGQVVEPGMEVFGGGGYLKRKGIELMAGAAVADAAAACAGQDGEIAIFNISSEVTITSD